MYRLIFVLSLFPLFYASCPEGSLEWQTNCFFFRNDTNEFMVAEMACAQKSGHLVSIHDALVNALLAQEAGHYFHESTVTDVWIGGTNMMPGGNWSWMDGSVFDFIDWAPGKPKNVTGNNCASLSVVDGFWRSDSCYNTKPYICKVEKTFYDPTTMTTSAKTTTTSKYPIYANCRFPFTYFQPTHSCYGAGNLTKALDWVTAENYCQEFGGHLSSIHSLEESLFLRDQIYTADADFWSGAFSNDNGITWKWSDETPWDYNPWIKGSPKNQTACGIIWGSGLGDYPCNTLLRPICKMNLT